MSFLGAVRQLRQLKRIPLVNVIDEQRWDLLAPNIRFIELADGELLYGAGSSSESLFLVVDGELGLYLPRPQHDGPGFLLQTRATGATVGDFAVLNGGEHLVSAIAQKKSRVASFPREAFELLTDIDPKILAHVYDTAAELSRRAMLSQTYLTLFGDVSETLMERLLNATTIAHFRSGEMVFEQGDEPDGLHIVVSGRLLVHAQKEANPRKAPIRPGTADIDTEVSHTQVAEVRAPETVGELALLSGGQRHATVIAARESTVARLSTQNFHRFIAPDPTLLMSLTRLVVQRQLLAQRTYDTRSPVAHRTFVAIPLSETLPLKRVFHQLKRALRTHGETVFLDAAGFDTLYGKTGAAETPFSGPFASSIAKWLDDKEERLDSLVYVADSAWTPWTERAVNRADRVLLFADATSQCAHLRDVELALRSAFEQARHGPRVELVLLHPPNTVSPSNTRRWLDVRHVDDFHHVRLDDRAHIGRLARRIAGKARGLVFSGGGARGYAHLGVQRFIEENDIAIDAIGGSSMGALLGAAMAMGQSYAEVSELSSRFANKRALFDYTVPLVSLMQSAKLTRFCQAVYGDVQIEDLWTPFFAVSSNLADGRAVKHVRGSLWETVRTTISLPGLFSPMATPEGDLLIDGAVLDTFPVGLMRERLAGSGEIIGINVGRFPERYHRFDHGPSLSGWRVLWSRIAPWQQGLRVPRIAETLLRATDIKDIERISERRSMIDLLVEPDVSEWSLLDFKHYQTIADVGYREAQQKLRSLSKSLND